MMKKNCWIVAAALCLAIAGWLLARIVVPRSDHERTDAPAAATESQAAEALAAEAPAEPAACGPSCTHAHGHGHDPAGSSSGPVPFEVDALASTDAPAPPVAPLAVRPTVGMWTPVETPDGAMYARAPRYRFDPAEMERALADLGPSPQTQRRVVPRIGEGPVVLDLPTPDGLGNARFRIRRGEVYAPGDRPPGDRSMLFGGRNVDNPHQTIAGGWSPENGFHALVTGGGEPSATYERPVDSVPEIVEVVNLATTVDEFVCDVDAAELAAEMDALLQGAGAKKGPISQKAVVVGGMLRTYRLAVASSVEATASLGGQAATDALINSWIMEINMIYERDLCVTFNRVGGVNLVFNAEPDGYDDPDRTQMLNANSGILDGILGANGYDIGHVLNSSSGGRAGPAPCQATSPPFGKGRGTSGVRFPANFAAGMFAHEIGHMFGAQHTFNGVSANCAGSNHSPNDAIEPGAGSSIMAYGGICGADDYPECAGPEDTKFFLHHSIEQMEAAIQGGLPCGTTIATGDIEPDVEAGPTKMIPINTLFELTATRLDTDTDTVTYSWEEANIAPAAAPLGAADDGDIPLFRALQPTTSPTRVFPKLDNILDCSYLTCVEEKLPQLPRTMEFACVIRDNKCGVGIDRTTVEVVNSGPFEITSPNGGETVSCNLTVTWNPNGTQNAPINAGQVDIRLSIDGGRTFPFPLALGTANDGSEAVTLPNIASTTARIRVQPVGQCFFDISLKDFTLQTCASDVLAAGPAILDDTDGCNANSSGALDPGECEVAVRVRIDNVSGAPATGVRGCLVANTPGVTVTEGDQPYGVIAAGGNALNAAPFRICIDPSVACGSVVDFTLEMKSDQGDSTALVQFPVGRLETHMVTYSAFSNGDPVVPVGPRDMGESFVPIPVAGLPGTIFDIDLEVGGQTCSSANSVTGNGINHDSERSLRISLQSPLGAANTMLSEGHTEWFGQGNLCNTRFDDEAVNTWEGAGPFNPPYTGSFIPDNPLGVFDGLSPNGTWQLTVQSGWNGPGAALADCVASGGSNPGCFSGDIREINLHITTVVCDPPLASADLSITKTATNCVEAGEDIVYTITVSNAGPDTATGIVVTDTFPPGLVTTAPTTVIVSSLASGATHSYMVTGTTPVGFAGFMTNHVSVTAGVCDPATNDNEAIAVTEVKPPPTLPDLAMIVTSTVNQAQCGDVFAIDVVVTNIGIGPAPGIVFTAAFDQCVVQIGDDSDACATNAQGEMVCGQLMPISLLGGEAFRVTVTGRYAQCQYDACNTATYAAEVAHPADNDPANNTDQHPLAILLDTAPPVFPGALHITNSLSCGTAVPAAPDRTATDNCAVDSVTTSALQVVGTSACGDDTSRYTYVAADCQGNASTATVTYVFDPDLTPPLFAGPLHVTNLLDCGQAIPAAPARDATDNCGLIGISTSALVVIGTSTCGDNTSRYTYVATDCGGNTATATVTYAFRPDTTPPAFVGAVHATNTLGCGEAVPAPAAPTVTDDCGVDTVNLIGAGPVGSPTACGDQPTRHTFVATDCGGNTATATVTYVYEEDQVPPQFDDGPAHTTNLLACLAPVPPPPTRSATDDCQVVSVMVVSTQIVGSSACGNTTRYDYVAIDCAGNETTGSVTYGFGLDPNPPVFTNTALHTTNLLDCGTAVPAAPHRGATDDCAVVSITTSAVIAVSTTVCGDVVSRYRYIARDCGGNETTATVTFVYQTDTNAPVFPAGLVLTNMLVCGTPVPAAPDHPATDDCGLAGIVTSAAVAVGAPTACGDQPSRYTYVATDCGGNTATATVTFVYQADTNAPVFPAGLVLTNMLVCGTPVPGAPDHPATDDCGLAGVVTSAAIAVGQPTACGDQPTRYDYQATDCGGNQTVGSVVFIFGDPSVPPAFDDGPAHRTNLVACGAAIPPPPARGATDDCAVATVMVVATNPVGPATACGTTTRYDYVAIGCGGLATTGSVTYGFGLDTNPPVFTNTALHTTNLLDCGTAVPAAPHRGATDDCAVVSITTSAVIAVSTTVCGDVVSRYRYIARDCGGNETTATVTFAFNEDLTPPAFVGPVHDTQFVGCGATVAPPARTATDDCGLLGVTLVASTPLGTDTCGVETVRFDYQAEDCAGNTSTATVTVLIGAADTNAPVFANPDMVIPVDCRDTQFPFVNQPVTDDCQVVELRTNTMAGPANACGVPGQIHHYIARDCAGNAATVTVTYVVDEDTTDPFFANPGTNFLALGCNPALPDPALVLATATDDCAVASTVLVEDMGVDQCQVTLTQTFTVVDACGRIGAFVRVIEYTRDQSPPMLDCSNSTTTLAFGTPLPQPAPIATDDCGATVTIDTNVLLVHTNGDEDTEFLIAATDCAGNIATCRLVYIYAAGPSFVCPGDMDLDCNPATFPDPADTLATATTDCPPLVSADVDIDRVTNAQCRVTETRTYTAIDSCGATGVCVQVLTWTEDTEPPILATAVPAHTNLGCNPAPADFPSLAFMATDNCGLRTSTVTSVTNGTPCAMVATTVFTAVDHCDQVAAFTAVVEWTEDTTPPVVNCPGGGDLGVNPGGPPPADPFNPTDNCGVCTTRITEVSDTNANCQVTFTRVYYAEDCCGFAVACTQVFQWLEGDNGPPVFSNCVSTSVLLAVGEALPPPPPFPVATDDCGAPTVTLTTNALATNAAGDVDTRYTFTAIDNFGNTAECSTTYLYPTNVAGPSFACQPPLALPCNPDPALIPDPAVLLASVTSDCPLVDAAVTVVRVTNGCTVTETQVAWAVDDCGQTGACTQTISWTEDNTDPGFAWTGTNELDLGCNPATIPGPAEVLATATDNCAVARSAAATTGVSNQCDNAITQSFEVVDACGNTGTWQRVIRWRSDTEPPTLAAPASTNLGCVVPVFDHAAVLATAADNCGVKTSWFDHAVGGAPCDMAATTVYTVVDLCDLTNSYTSVVTWTEDSQDPRFAWTGTNELDLGCNPATIPGPAEVLATATDNCAVARSAAATTGVSNQCDNAITQSFEVVDACGNTGTWQRVIRWRSDTEPPTLAAPASTNLGCVVPVFDHAAVLATAADNCGVKTSWFDHAVGGDPCDMAATTVYTVVDLCDLTNSYTSVVTWTEDSQDPVFTYAGATTETLGCNTALPDPAIVLATATDNCAVARATMTETAGTNGCDIVATQTFTAVDACGRSGTFVRVLHYIRDNTAPALDCLNSTTMLPAGSALPVPNPTVTDDCGATLVVVTNVLMVQTNGDVDTEYLISATDCAGRSATCRVVYLYQPPVAGPVFACPGDLDLDCNPTMFPDMAVTLASVTSDCLPIVFSTVMVSRVTNAACLVEETRTYLAIDDCDQTGTCVQVLTWTEDTAPPIFAGAPVATQDHGCVVSAPTPFDPAGVTVTDACCLATSGYSQVTNTSGCSTEVITTWWAVDCCDNTGRYTAVERWTEDLDPPMFTYAGTNHLDLGCNPTAADFPNDEAAILATATDNCAVVTTRLDTATATNGCDIVVTQTFLAGDLCNGFGGAFVRVLTWTEDTEPPTLTAPAGTNLGCVAPAIDHAAVLATAADNCGLRTATVSSVTNGTPCAMVATTVYTVIDHCGLTTAHTTVVTWTEDDTDPTFAWTGTNDLDLGCNPTALPGTAAVLATATDNCGLDRTEASVSTVTNGSETRITQTFIAIDSCGNTGTWQRVVRFVIDTAPPTLDPVPVAFINLGCNPAPADFVFPAPVPMDDNGVRSSSVVSVTNAIGCGFEVTAVHTVVDLCDHIAVYTSVVAWTEDTGDPRFDFPGASILFLGCNPVLPDPADVLATATDNCGVVSTGLDEFALTNGCDIALTQTFWAVDGCDRTGTWERVVLYTLDTEPPVLDCSNATVRLPAGSALPVPGPTATDDCGVTVTVVTNILLVHTNGDRDTRYDIAAADCAGRVATCRVTYLYQPPTAGPAFACPMDADLPCNPSSFPDPAAVLATATSDCLPIVTSGVSAVRLTNGCTVTMTRSYWAVDACGATGTCVQTLTWTEDTEPPSFSNLPPTLVDLDCQPDRVVLPDPGLVTAADNCCLLTSGYTVVTNMDAGCGYSATVTWWAEDCCGNTNAHRTTYLALTDTAPPAFTHTGATAVVLGCDPTALPDDSAAVIASVTDDCGLVQTMVQTSMVRTGCTVTLTETYTAVDACLHTAVWRRTITYTEDLAPPVLDCMDETVMLPAGSPLPQPAPTATDDCGAAVTIATNILATNAHGDVETEFVVTATDCAGRGDTCVLTYLYLAPTTNPVFACPMDLTLPDCDPTSFPDPAAVLATATSACPITGTTVLVARVTNGCTVTMTRTYWAIDACGATGTCVQAITWTQDTAGPVFANLPPAYTDLHCTTAPNLPDPAAVSATDDCCVPTIGSLTTTNTAGCRRTVTTVWTAEDCCGNASAFTSVTEWTADDQPPSFAWTGALDLVIGAGDPLPPTEPVFASASDNCGVVSTNLVVLQIDPNRIEQQFHAGDACGRTGVLVRTITIMAVTQTPSIAVGITVGDPGCFCEHGPGAFTIAVTNDGPVALTDVTIDDPGYPDCSTNIGPLAVGASLEYQCAVVLTGTLNQVFASGRAGPLTATDRKTVIYTFDGAAPTIVSCPADATIDCRVTLPPPAPQSVVATDDCPAAITIRVTTNTVPGCAGDGVQYTYTAVDACGNESAPCVQTIVRGDSGGPSFDTAVQDKVLACGDTAAPETVGATDACDGDLTVAVASGSIPAGCATRPGVQYIYTARDACGNAIAMTQRVTFVDTVGPVFSAVPQDMVLGCGDSLPQQMTLSATDACAGPVPVQYGQRPLPAACALLDGVEYTYRATDACGNASAVTQRITYAARGVPTFSALPPGGELACSDQLPAALPILATDACGEALEVRVQTRLTPAGCTGLQGIEHTYRATDDCGQEAVHTETWTYADRTPPVLDCRPGGEITGVGASCRVPVPNVLRSATDACGQPTVVQTPAAGSPHDATQPLTVTTVARDACGNATTCTVDFTFVCNVRLAGVVWEDMSGDGDPGDENLNSLGIGGIPVTLLDLNGQVVASTTTATNGLFEFDVPQAMYRLVFDLDALPPGLGDISAGAGTIDIDATSGAGFGDVNLGFASIPTAVHLAAFRATVRDGGVDLAWTTGAEINHLGFRVWRGDETNATVALPDFVLGQGGASAYSARDETVSAWYWLESVDTSLGTTLHGPFRSEIPAAPEGEPTDIVQAIDGRAAFTAAEGVRSYLVVGFATAPTAIDAATGARIAGEILQTENGFGLYFSVPAGTQVEVRE